MARRSSKDTQYLEEHRKKWRVTISVPKHLHGQLGTRLKRPLHTDSLTVANQLKWPIVNELTALIASAGAGHRPDMDLIASEFRQQLRHAKSDEAREEIEEHISITAETLLGEPTGSTLHPATGEPLPVYASNRLKSSRRFVQLAEGTGTPIEQLHPQYLAQLTVKPRTLGDDTRAILLLRRWCDEKDVEPFLQSFNNRRVAARFMDDLPNLEEGLTPVTLNKYLGRLSMYWRWLAKREEVDINVWQGMTLPEPEKAHDEVERPFTADEMVRLLTGDASQAMHDLMRIAALTGCRLDPIVCLRVQDCREDGVFIFKPQKREKVERLCPIHPDLREIVTRRTQGRASSDPLFPEWPPPKKAGSQRERSFKASNHFTAYRRSVGVSEELAGRRRSLVNFHSFRRWFVTEAERAGQPEHLIAVAVGHKRQGITLGVYSAGPLIEQVRAVVEAVKLPSQ